MEVLAGVVVVLVSVLAPVTGAPPLLVVSLSPLEPPPVGVVVAPFEPALAPVLELELEFDVELVPLFVDEELFELFELDVAWVSAVAALVVGTISGGAPLVSLLPAPLPPQAASAIAAATAAPAAMMVRKWRLSNLVCMRPRRSPT